MLVLIYHGLLLAKTYTTASLASAERENQVGDNFVIRLTEKKITFKVMQNLCQEKLCEVLLNKYFNKLILN